MMGTYHEVNRYIDADELVQWFMSNLENYLMENPEDVAPVIHAHWIEKTFTFACSACNRDSVDNYAYCPRCGAKMNEVKT